MLRKPTLVSVLALCILFTSSSVYALGLGGMRTQSALNQPFFAEIDLLDVNSDELDAVKVRLAGRDEFDKAGAERPHFLTRLSFVPMIGAGGRPIVQVTSREPIREPYLDFLVEVLWPGGRLVKEYTVLMDLPGRGARSAPRVVQPQTSPPVRRPPPQPRVQAQERAPSPPRRSPAPSVEPTAPAQPAPVATSREPDQAPTQPPTRPPTPRSADTVSDSGPAPEPQQAASTVFPIDYTVPRGLGLWRIARRLTPPGATVEQTAMALYRNNQDAFARGDINTLMVGAELSIPSAEELFALDPAAAKREFQDALAGRSVTTEPIADTPVQAELRIAAPVEESGEPAASPAVTDASAVPSAAGPEGAPAAERGPQPDLEEDLLLVRETSESNRQETTELRNRVLELEDQLEDIRRLLQLRNDQLAELQQVARVGELEVAALAVAQPDAGAPTEADAEQQEAARAAAESAAEAGATVVEDQSATASHEGTAEPEAGLEPSAADPSAADLGEGDLGAADDIGMLGSMLRTLWGVPPWALAAGGGGLLVGALGLLALRRRRQLATAQPDPAVRGIDDSAAGGSRKAASAFAAGSLAAAPGYAAEFGDDLSLDLDLISDSELGDADQSVLAGAAGAESGHDIDERIGLPSSAAAPASYQQPETQETDILAEADIYLLYGRFREAEAILQEEIQNDPDRADLKYKLAEAYIGSGNSEALTALAEQMRAAGDEVADPDKWTRISEALSSPADAKRPEPAAASTTAAAASGDLDIGAALGAADQASGELLDDSEDTGLGFSVQELNPSDADEVQQKLADLELDLQGLDGLGDLDDDSDAVRAVDGQGAASAAARPSLESELGMLDAGAQTWASTPPRSGPTPEPNQGGPAQWSSSDSEDLDLDLDALKTFGLGGDERLPPAELNGPATASPDASGRLPSAGSDDDLGAALEPGGDDDWALAQASAESSAWDESATKMDLARAYMAMEDPSAARTILEEVVQEGNAAQQAEAKALIETLG